MICTVILYILRRLLTMANRTTYTQARAHLASLCNQVAETREPYIIERRNGENVALISEAELLSLLETVHLLRSPANARRLAAALERALGDEEPPSSIEELRRSLGIDAPAE
jgi:antitoxin YefM